MQLREKAKQLMPDSAYQQLRRLKRHHELRKLLRKQYQQFNKYAAIAGNESQDELETLLQYHSHEIEKGLSHHDFRPKFGVQAIQHLTDTLARWERHGYSWNAFGAKEALSVLKNYRLKHEAMGVSVPDFYQEMTAPWKDLIDNADSEDSGISVFVYHQSTNHRTYSQVLQDRVSLRNYSATPVSEDILIEAGTLAMRAPSVCNRQSARLYVITNQQVINQAMNMQAGMNGYPKPPALLVVTSKISSFVDPTERNEPYVDGGLYSMALLGALEEQNLAACPLNTMFEKRREVGVREILHLPDDEVLIMFIAVGNKPEKALHPKSLRRPAKDIIKCIR